MTRPKKYKRYSAEFKREAIRRAAEEGRTDREVRNELGISERQFRRWRDELHVLGADAFPGSGHSRDDEVTRLKRELVQVNKERDFLKEAAASSPVSAPLAGSSPATPPMVIQSPTFAMCLCNVVVGADRLGCTGRRRSLHSRAQERRSVDAW